MQYYVRKAGVETAGISDNLNLHNPLHDQKILQLKWIKCHGRHFFTTRGSDWLFLSVLSVH